MVMMFRSWQCGDLAGFRAWVFWAELHMGCGGSKVDDLPLVTHCRERKEFIKAASEQRYALASAHVAYFRSLRVVGDAFSRFVEEELVIGVSTPLDSPVLNLPSDERKSKKKGNNDNHCFNGSPSSSSLVSRLASSPSDHHSPLANQEEDASHLHLSSGSDLELDTTSSSGHIHMEDSPKVGEPSSYYQPPDDVWNHYNAHYMKKSSTAVPSVIYEEPQPSSIHWSDSPGPYSYDQRVGYPGLSGFPMGPSPMGHAYSNQETPTPPPPAPPSPNVSSWDFLNPFNGYHDIYGGYYAQSDRFHGSMSSSPDSKELREKEGIPELEEETEQIPSKEVPQGKKMSSIECTKSSGEGTSRAVPSQNTSRAAPSQNSDKHPLAAKPDIESLVSTDEETKASSTNTISSKSSRVTSVEKKGEISELEVHPTQDIDSSKHSSITTFSAHGTRDLQDVVKEIKCEFEAASGIGKEVAMLLEADKVPYQPRNTVVRAIFSKILYFVVPSISSSHLPSSQSVQFASNKVKMTKAYSEDPGMANSTKVCNLSTILEKLYAWEKKLHKEVKDEERLRIIYEKKCKRLKLLDDRGADSYKIDAIQASIRKLLTRINVCIRGIGAISSQIEKLRDEELQPQLIELINGWTRMWKLMLKCHQKQFQAVMESKHHPLRMRTCIQRDSSLRATSELEMELLKWGSRFSNWVSKQRSYVESLNGWLVRCLLQEQEKTADGLAPFSPGRAGAPPVAVICNDWCQAMQRVEETGVAHTVSEFARNLHQLWKKLDDEQNQRLKAEHLSKDFDKQLKMLHMERARVEESNGPMVRVENGISKLDNLRFELDLMNKRLAEERVRHKGAVKIVNDAATSSIQADLLPIFNALTHFTSEASKAHEQVRIQNAGKVLKASVDSRP